MALPSGYTELEYIASSGTQYIDTGFYPDSNSRIVLDFENTGDYASNNGSLAALFGARNATTSAVFATWVKTDSIQPHYGNSSVGAAPSFVTDVFARHKYELNGNIATLDGETVTCPAATFTTNYSLYLFTLNSAGSAESRKTSAKLYSCQIYNNGTLVRDFVPCKNPSSEIGLYDLVNNVFCGNVGSGEFVAGHKLPSNYTELYYIESTGAQYINTGFKPNQNSRCVMDVDVTSGGTVALFGARTDTTTASFVFFQITGSYLRSDYGTQQTNIQLNPVQRLKIDKNKNITTVNDVSVTATAESFQTGCDLLLFTVNTNNAVGSAKLASRLYSCQVYDNGLLVRDYVPCVNSDDEVGLYDRVNNAFYNNAGTGVFIAGEPVAPEVEYPAPTLVSDAPGIVTITWDAVENADRYIIYADQMPYSVSESNTATIYGLRPSTEVLLAYDPVIEGEESNTSAELLVTIPSWQGLNLITDRTAADVSLVKEIADKIKNNTVTVAELAQYVAGLKGAYKADDLNRVGAAVGFVAEALTAAGYAFVPTLRTDWTDADYFYPADLQEYLANIEGLRSALAVWQETPETPTGLKTYQQANDLEKIIEDVYQAYLNMAAAYFYLDELYMGEV